MPAILTPVNAEASKLSARRSSTSRLWTDDLPQAFASAVISIVMAVRYRATRSAPAWRVHAFLQLRVLRRDADRATARVAVVTGPGAVPSA